MKLSTRARYGLRLCFLLGVAKEPTVSLTLLVKETSLSEKYLEQILHKLKNGGVVDAKRGTSGGYYLIDSPQNISIDRILHALDDGFEFSDCATGKCKDTYCPNKRIFKRIYNGVDAILKNTTLQDMIDDYRCLPNKNTDKVLAESGIPTINEPIIEKSTKSIKENA